MYLRDWLLEVGRWTAVGSTRLRTSSGPLHHGLTVPYEFGAATETEAYVRKYARSGTSASREALGMAGRRKRLLSSLIIFGEAAEALLL